MRPIDRVYDSPRDAGVYALRDGVERMTRASAAIARAGTEDADKDARALDDESNRDAARVTISRKPRPGEPVRHEDLLGNLLELYRSGVTVATGVAVIKTADEMERTALSIGGERHR